MDNTKKKLMLITAGFPFGESEQSFLKTEFTTLCQTFHVNVLAMNTTEPMIHPFTENATVTRYSLPPLKSIKTLKYVFRLLNKDVFYEYRLAKENCSFRTWIKRIISISAEYINSIAASKKINEIVQQDSIDIVYTYWCTSMTIGSILLKKKYSNLKVITRFHGVDLYNERTSANWQPFRRLIREKSDKLIFACNAAKEYFQKNWGSSKKYLVSYLGCPTMDKIEYSPHNTLNIVSCSNLIPLKRVNLITEALSIMPKSIQVNWHHIGDGPEKDKLIKQAKEILGSKPNISYVFTGAVPNKDIPLIYKEIIPDVFITTTSSEGGAPVSIQEAFAMGIPAIATDVGGIPDLVNDRTGILLPTNPTAEQIAAAIKRIYYMSDNWKKTMRDNAYTHWLECFNAKTNAHRLLNIFFEMD